MNSDYKPELMHVDIPPEMIRDPAAELRAKKAQRHKSCERCGKTWQDPVTGRVLAAHQERFSCQAVFKRKQMIDAGFTIIPQGGFVNRVMQAGGLNIRSEATEYEKGKGLAWGRGKSHPGFLKKELWVPRWITKLLENDWKLTEGFNREDVEPLFGLFIRELNEDREKRQGAIAAHRLGGVDAIRGFVLTPGFRAKKLREEAIKKRAEADKLDRQAAELEPFNTLPEAEEPT